MEALLRWKWYPAIFRIPLFFGSFYLLYVLLFGDQTEGRNSGLSILWVLMWSLQPIMFVVFGRFWCGICPFSSAGELAKKMVGNEIHPPLFLKKHGVWFAYVFFIIILVIETLVHMSTSTAATSILLFTIFTMAIISGAFFKRRAWCRYLCPLGVAGGVFSRLRVIKLSKDDKICNECKEFECFKGTMNIEGCPMGLCVKKHDMDADCISCGNCLKNCPNGSPHIRLYSPGRAFLNNFKMNQAEAAFAGSFIGLSIAIYLIKDFHHVINMTVGFKNALWNDILVITLFTGLSFLLLYLFSYIIHPVSRQSQKHNFGFFGFFLIPYILFGLFNLTSVHEVFMNGTSLYYNLTEPEMITVPGNLIHPLVNVKVLHFIQGMIILSASFISIFFCWRQLRKALKNRQRNIIIALFSIFLLMITGYSLYLLLFL
jgi:ferredoxin